MKYRIKQILSLGLAISMLLSLIPLYGAAMIDEFEGLETVEEIPFEFVLEPGDLPHELLREAVLAPEDLPSCIDPELAEARGHVNRLYLQEPDDRTVMFQNRDGSKTVYLFSHPVKGMSASTVSSFEISGTRLSFTFSNAITSRVGVTLSNFNIGYAEVAYIPGGVLTEDGVNITEDVRDWARGESTVSALAYNISGEAAAEYAASVAVPETDAAATAAAAPGITITPNDPAPLGGMTVMSISYSDLAGVMSFKSVSANNYLILHPNNRSSLMMYPRPISPYSRWVVSYDSYFGYTLTNLYHPESKYIGFDEDGDFAIAPIDDLIEAFRVDIVSSSNNSVNVTISDGGFAIDSTASLYLNDPDDTSYPTSCQWTIYTKTDYAPVQSITTSRIRTVNAEEPFYEAYTTNPAEPTYSDINLHFASNNQVVPTDSDFDMDDLRAYVIAEPGMYQVYYKDVSSGVRSANFWLNVVQNVQGITPASSVRIEQSGVGFDLDYTVLPELANNYSISLYYASNDEEVDYEEDEYGEPDYYYIDTPGIYSVYYKDSVSGVTSENFLLVITEVNEENDFSSNKTYSIRPVNAPTYYLSMSGSSVQANGYNSLVVSEMSFTLNEDIKTTTANSNPDSYQLIDVSYERWNTVSRLFKFDAVPNMDSVYMISAILSTSQATRPNVAIDGGDYDGAAYNLRDDTEVPNTINYSGTTPQTKVYSDEDPNTYIIPCNMGSYYVLICLNTFNSTTGTVEVLKYVSGGVELSEYSVSDTSLRWYVNHVGVDAPLIMQTRNYFCGYTNVLQVLHGAGYKNIISGNDLNEKIEKIATDYGQPLKMADSFSVYSNILSKYVTNTTLTAHRDSINHFWHPCSITQQEMVDKIEASLDLGWAPMILSFAGNVPFKQAYYNKDDEVTGHYIVVIGYDQASDCVIISNCHYADKANGTENERMFGIFAIPASDFYNAVGYLYTMS